MTGGDDDGWRASADAWVREQGEHGDYGRAHVLDPVMIPRLRGRGVQTALDVGCGEGRFCRIMAAEGIRATGVDPTPELLAVARERDPAGDYRAGRAEALDFPDASFDLVVSYLTLIDIPDIAAAIPEMARVLKPGGRLLVANLTGFTSASADRGWQYDTDGRPDHFALDRYLETRPMRVGWRGIEIVNWHRPLSAYMQLFLKAGLRLAWFDEPAPTGGPADQAARYARVPYFVAMEWHHAGITDAGDGGTAR